MSRFSKKFYLATLLAVSDVYDGIQVALHAPAVKPTSIKYDRFYCIFGGLFVNCICKLYFPTGSCRLITQYIKNVWRQHVTTNAGKVRRYFVGIGFFHKGRN